MQLRYRLATILKEHQLPSTKKQKALHNHDLEQKIAKRSSNESENDRAHKFQIITSSCIFLSLFCVCLSNFKIGNKVVLIHQERWQHTFPQRTKQRFGKIRGERGGNSKQASIGFQKTDQVLLDGYFITEILRGKVPFPSNGIYHRLKFRPGTLQMTSAEALRHCYVNETRYENHFFNTKTSFGDPILSVVISQTHKLIYRNIAKSSSSSGRHAMKNIFNGSERSLVPNQLKNFIYTQNYTLVSFIREPLNRFYSSYDEAVFRLGPWMGEGPIVNDKPRVRKWYHEVKHRVEAYPYLYEGLQTIEDYRRMYCPAYLLEHNEYQKCNEVESIDNGDLTRRFEQFVRDYDGLHPFDIHLSLQTTSLISPDDGKPFPVYALFNATEAELGWEEIARQKGVPIPEEGMTHGRKQTRRFNMKLVSAETKRRICQLVALDYCCLNLKLPDECTMGGLDDEANVVFCALDLVKNMDFASEKRDLPILDNHIVIQPWDY